MSAIRVVLYLMLLCFAAFSPCSAEEASGGGRRALLVMSYDLRHPETWNLIGDLESRIDRLGYGMNFNLVALDAMHDHNPENWQCEFDRQLPLLQNDWYDLIVAIGGNACDLVLENYDRIPQNIPVVFVGCEKYSPELKDKYPNITGVMHEFDVLGTVLDGVRMFPETKKITVLSDSSAPSVALFEQLKTALPPLDNVTLEYLDGNAMPFNALLERIGALPPESLLVILPWSRLGDGRSFVAFGSGVIAAAGCPVLVNDDSMFGLGALGGNVTTAAGQAAAAATVIGRVLADGSARNVPMVTAASAPMFDSRKLDALGVDRKTLAPGAILLFESADFLTAHRKDLGVIIGVALLAATLFGIYTFAVRRAAKRALRFYRALPGRVGVCNRRGEILFSQSDGTVENYRKIEDLPDVDVKKFNAAAAAVFSDGAERTIDYECNGVKRSVTFAPLDAGLFGQSAVVWASHDNTDIQDARLRAENLAVQLRKNTRMWDIVINSLPVYIFAKDADNNYRYVFANHSAHSFLNRPDGSIVGMDDFELFPKNVAAALRRDDEEVMTSHLSGLEKNFRFRRDNGAPVVCKLIRRPFLDSDGTRLLLGAAIDVSELEAARQTAQDAAERFQLTLRSIGDAVIATDRDGRITIMNHAAEELVGCRLDDVKGTSVNSVLRLIDRNSDRPLPSPVAAALDNDDSSAIDVEADLISLDGHRYRISCGASPIRDKAGVAIGVILVVRNVSGSGSVDADRIRQLFDYCTDFTHTATIEYDIGTGEIVGSKLFPEMWAFENGSPVPWSKWIFREDQEAYSTQFSRLLSGRVDRVSSIYRSDYNGELRYFRSAGSIDRGNPEQMRIFGVIQDVTDVVRGIGKLQSSMELWNMVVNSMPFLFFAKDADDEYRYVMVNEAFERFVGLPRSEIIGHNNEELFPNAVDPGPFRMHDEEAMASSGFLSEFMQIALDGSGVSHSLKTVKRKYVGADGTRLLLSASVDVTELKSLLDNEQIVNRVLKAVAVEADFEKNLTTIMNTIAEQMHCDRILVGIFDGVSRMCFHREWRGRDIPELGAAGVDAFFRICSGVLETLGQGRQVVYNKFKDHREFCEMTACAGNYQMKSIVITPVMVAGRMWGAFSVAFASDQRRVTGIDERALAAVASIISLAVSRSGR